MKRTRFIFIDKLNMSTDQNSPTQTKGNCIATYSQQSTTPCCSSSSYATSVDWDNISIENGNEETAQIQWLKSALKNSQLNATASRELRMQNARMRAEINTLRGALNDRHHNNSCAPKFTYPHIQPAKYPVVASTQSWKPCGGGGFTHSYGMPANKMKRQIRPKISWLDRFKDFCWFLLLLSSFLVMYSAQNGVLLVMAGWRAFFHFKMWMWFSFGMGFILNIVFFQILPFLYALIKGRKFHRPDFISRVQVYWVITIWLLLIPTLIFLLCHYFLGHPLLTPPDTKFASSDLFICDDGEGRNKRCITVNRAYALIWFWLLIFSWIFVNGVDIYFMQHVIFE